MISYETHKSPFVSYVSTNMNFLIHFHPEIELLYVTKGSVEVTVQQTTYTVVANELVVIMPHTLHSYSTPDFSEYILIIIKPSLITYYQSFMAKQCACPIISQDKLHPDIPDYLKALTLHDTIQNTGLLKGYLYLLFARIIPSIDFISPSIAPRHALIYRCLDYIHLHYTEIITLDLLASYLGVNSSYVSRLFNKTIGYSFTYYLNTLRIDYAKYLLKESTLSITQISFECGYQTLRHFNRIFKELTGHAPSTYQLLTRKELLPQGCSHA